jgi:Ca2+-binding RTX toxin-like protein
MAVAMILATVVVAGAWAMMAAARQSAQTCFGEPATIVRGDGGVNVSGTDGDDVIVTGSGKDQIDAKSGRDRICSGGGNDNVSTGDGPDRVKSGPVDDLLSGGGR